ncbi:hypothetical protein C9374_004764 [Naegleria lovaniensis]|uniref:F-box domain-containing protein n=1 Tax=Naegleria lovaniensis TaxID=51637 RepID=A0AA88GQS6_NAELO|nr:uncharacterized protein C9374_004764 [Naegleria lovaniensis]KAG2382797.1 hypothetical protein C9374_004764 [Naegleria lovaniensis]
MPTTIRSYSSNFFTEITSPLPLLTSPRNDGPSTTITSTFETVVNMNALPCFQSLPEELLVFIFTFLPLQSIHVLFQVCKYFHSLAQSDCIWRQQFVNLMVLSHHQAHVSSTEITTNGNNQNGNSTNHLMSLANSILPMRQLFSTFSISKIIQKLQSQYLTLFQNSIQDFTQVHPAMTQHLHHKQREVSNCGGLLLDPDSYVTNPLRRRFIAKRRGMGWMLNQLLHNEFVIQCLLVRELLKENVSQNFQIHVKPEFYDHSNVTHEMNECWSDYHKQEPEESIHVLNDSIETESVGNTHSISSMNFNENDESKLSQHFHPSATKTTQLCMETHHHHPQDSKFPTPCNCFYILCEYLMKMNHHYGKIDSREYLGLRMIKALKIYQTFVFPVCLALLILLSMCLHGAYFEFWNKSKADIYVLGLIASVLLLMGSWLWVLCIFVSFLLQAIEKSFHCTSSRPSQEFNSILCIFYMSMQWLPALSMCYFVKAFMNSSVPFLALSGISFFLIGCNMFILYRFRLLKCASTFEKLVGILGMVILFMMFLVTIPISIKVDFQLKLFSGYVSIVLCAPLALIVFVFQTQMYVVVQAFAYWFRTTLVHPLRVSMGSAFVLASLISAFVSVPAVVGIVLMSLRIDGLISWNYLYLCTPFLVTLLSQFAIIAQFLTSR